jgi:NAD(P)H dehydrogenase (quinone)
MAEASRQARILVLYHTDAGNTRLMADLVGEGAAGVPETDVRLRGVDEATADDLLWCDGMAVGSPTNMGTVSWQMKRFWDVTAQTLWPKTEGKFGRAFSSSGRVAGGGELTCVSILTIPVNYGMFTFGIPNDVAPGRTLHYGAVCAGRRATKPTVRPADVSAGAWPSGSRRSSRGDPSSRRSPSPMTAGPEAA